MPSTSSTWRAIAASLSIVFAVGLAGCKSKPVEEKAAPPTEAPAEKAELPPAPADFPQMKIPEDNPQTPEKIALGHQLFFDARPRGADVTLGHALTGEPSHDDGGWLGGSGEQQKQRGEEHPPLLARSLRRPKPLVQ